MMHTWVTYEWAVEAYVSYLLVWLQVIKTEAPVKRLAAEEQDTVFSFGRMKTNAEIRLQCWIYICQTARYVSEWMLIPLR